MLGEGAVDEGMGDGPDVGRGHDYDPNWDYEALDTRPGGKLGTMLDEAEAEARDDLLPALGLRGMDVFLVAEGGLRDGAMGRYVDGTASWPVIGLDLAAIAARAEDEALDLRDEIRITIAHELAHGWQEAAGLDDGEHEDVAERFARVWAAGGGADISILEEDDEPHLRGR